MEVNSKEAAAQAVKRGAELSALLGATIANRDQAVLAIEKRYGSTASQLTAQISAIEAGLAAWAKKNRGQFAGAQTLKFPCGEIAFQAGKRSCEPLKGWTWEKVIARARRLLSWRKYIRVKFEINRQRILEDTKGDRPKLKADRLETIGLEVKRAPETFSVEYVLKTKVGGKP